jgi:hypothetical protein
MRQETESSRLTAGRAGCAQREGRGRSRTLNASTKSAVKEYGERERERERRNSRGTTTSQRPSAHGSRSRQKSAACPSKKHASTRPTLDTLVAFSLVVSSRRSSPSYPILRGCHFCSRRPAKIRDLRAISSKPLPHTRCAPLAHRGALCLHSYTACFASKYLLFIGGYGSS